VFPNPATDMVNLEFSSSFLGIEYEVISFNGQVVHTGKISDTRITLDCSAYAKGSYFLRASSSLGTISRTFQVN